MLYSIRGQAMVVMDKKKSYRRLQSPHAQRVATLCIENVSPMLMLTSFPQDIRNTVQLHFIHPCIKTYSFCGGHEGNEEADRLAKIRTTCNEKHLDAGIQR